MSSQNVCVCVRGVGGALSAQAAGPHLSVRCTLR